MATLDFSPLDFRNAILADPAGKATAQTISDLFGSATGALRERQERKEGIKKDFISQMAYDTSITGNNIINNRVAHEYGKLRDKHLKVYQDRKGWLKPDDMIALRSDMLALTNLANSLKGVQNMYDNARRAALTKDGQQRFELNTEAWGDLMSVISGETDTPNLIGYLSDLQKSDTEFPFLDYRGYDLGTLLNSSRKAYRQQHKGDTKETVRQVEKEGKTYAATTKTIEYGDEKTARKFFKDSFLGNPYATNYSKGLQSELTDRQKEEALKAYGPDSDNPSETPYLDYYVDNVFDPGKYTQETATVRSVIKPAPKRTGGGGLSLFFGGGTSGPDQYKPKADNVEGVTFDEYVEFAKAGRTPKTVEGVTVTGAQRIKEGQATGAPADINTPSDYKVIGYSLDRGKIILTQQERGPIGQITKTYMVPYQGNEHFLKKLFDDATMKEIERRASQGKAAAETTDKWSKYKRQ